MIPGSASPFFLGSSLAVGGGGGGGYQIERSLRFNSSDSAYLSRTPSSSGNRKTWTISLWCKRSQLGTAQQGLIEQGTGAGTDTWAGIFFSSSDQLYGGFGLPGAGTYRVSAAVFRDTSAWYHIVLSVDTTQATASDRVKLWVNNAQVTAFSDQTTDAQNTDSIMNTTNPFVIGQRRNSSTAYFNGYLADIYFIDGQALTPSSFTEVSATTGQLIPKAYTGTFTGNSFWLKFSDNSSTTSGSNVGIGKDFSGLGNYWNSTGLSVTAGAGNDSLVDTPTSYGTDTGAGGEVRGNYCTLNPLQSNGGTLSNGNLDYATSTATVFHAMGTIGVSSGKWYFEFTRNAGNSAYPFVGVFKQGGSVGSYLGETSDAWTLILDSTYNGYWRSGGTLSGSSAGTFVNGDIAMVAVDMDAGKIWFGRNGTWAASGNPASGTNAQYTNLSGTVTPAVAMYQSAGATVNFGQRPFAYTAPSGFKALVDTNLTAPVVAKPNTAMDVKLYTGNGTGQAITGLAFSPDFIWTKSRSRVDNHGLHDIVRGRASNLYSDLTNPENISSAGADLVSFDANGYTLGTVEQTAMNRSGETYVAWTWDAGTSTVTNTQGSITSQVRANASAGFSIVTYTGNGSSGATIGHSLGVAPAFVAVKRRDVADSWIVYHSSTGNTKYLLLNNTTAATTYSGTWNNAGPSSTTITLGNDVGVNASSGTYVCYAWTPVAGYSSFGSYTGNGSADGPFVFTGHRSRWLMVKRSDAGLNDWYVLDTARSTYNVAINELLANSSSAENPYTGVDFDLLSNGFKIRATEGSINASGGTFIYASFAEFPFAYARAR